MHGAINVSAAGRLSRRLAVKLFCAGVVACSGGANDSTANMVASIGETAVTGVTQSIGTAGGPGSADGSGELARFDVPRGIASDSHGNLYVADSHNYTIRKITPAGAVTTIAGKTEIAGSVDGIGEDARFGGPFHITADATGNLYVTDLNAVRKITPAGAVSTLAGAVAAGSADGAGSGARFNNPSGITIDAAANLYVADSGNNTIRKITQAGAVTTLAGTAGVAGNSDGAGTAAQFRQPQGIIVDATGTLFVADRDNHVIRKITPAGLVTTLTGTPGIVGTADSGRTPAEFLSPQGIATGMDGTLYVVDSSLFPGTCLCEGAGTIRRISPAGVVTTLAGTTKAFGSADGTGPEARFNLPLGITVNTDGNLYVVDSLNHTIRRITKAGVVTTFAGMARLQNAAPGSFGKSE